MTKKPTFISIFDLGYCIFEFGRAYVFCVFNPLDFPPVEEGEGSAPIDPCGGYVHCHAAGVGLIKCVEHNEIVDNTLYAKSCNIDPGTAKPLPESLAFAAQDIRLAIDDHCVR